MIAVRCCDEGSENPSAYRKPISLLLRALGASADAVAHGVTWNEQNIAQQPHLREALKQAMKRLLSSGRKYTCAAAKDSKVQLRSDQHGARSSISCQ